MEREGQQGGKQNLRGRERSSQTDRLIQWADSRRQCVLTHTVNNSSKEADLIGSNKNKKPEFNHHPSLYRAKYGCEIVFELHNLLCCSFQFQQHFL